MPPLRFLPRFLYAYAFVFFCCRHFLPMMLSSLAFATPRLRLARLMLSHFILIRQRTSQHAAMLLFSHA